ncbi:heat shock cognate 70 kDa protein [Tanacetum coccineum]
MDDLWKENQNLRQKDARTSSDFPSWGDGIEEVECRQILLLPLPLPQDVPESRETDSKETFLGPLLFLDPFVFISFSSGLQRLKLFRKEPEQLLKKAMNVLHHTRLAKEVSVKFLSSHAFMISKPNKKALNTVCEQLEYMKTPDVKRLIEGRFVDPRVQKDIDLWPFKVIKGPTKEPCFVVEYKGEHKHFSPEELLAMVLQKMKLDAEDYIGREVTDVVIIVPAYFNNQQREATKKAGTFAGLKVVELLMSLLEIIKSSVINVKAVGGDTCLGGEDFDKTLVNYCINEFKRKHWEVDIMIRTG